MKKLCRSPEVRPGKGNLDYTVYLRTAQHFTDEPKSSLVLSRQAVDGSLQTESWEDDDPDALARSGILGEYEDFFRSVRDPLHATLSNFRNAVHSMIIAESIEAGLDYRDPS